MTSFDIKIEINQLIQNWCMANSKFINFDLISNELIKIINNFLMLEGEKIKSEKDVLFRLRNNQVNFEEIIIQYIFCLDSYLDELIKIDGEDNIKFDYKTLISYVYKYLSEIIFKYKTQSQ